MQSQPLQEGFVPITLPIFNRSSGGPNGFPGNLGKIHALSWRKYQEVAMKKALGVLAAVAVLGATALSAPAEARGRGVGPGLAFGLAAGAIAAGAAASAYPYYYGPDYYGPRYYYGPGPYAYYGGPYRHRYYRDW